MVVRNKKNRGSGFTILEVMLVLAATAFLFLIAASFIGGDETKTQFNQATNDFVSQLQKTMNNVTNGYYPSYENFACTAGSPPSLTTLSQNQRGSNNGCIFLGQVLQFAVGATTTSPTIDELTIIGDQFDPSSPTTLIQSLTDSGSNPILLEPAINTPPQSIALEYGLNTAWICITNACSSAAGPGTVGAIALASESVNGNVTISNSQQTVIYGVNGTSLGQPELPNLPSSTPVFITPSSEGVRMCFNSAATNQSVLVTISGSNNSPNSVSTNVMNGHGCA